MGNVVHRATTQPETRPTSSGETSIMRIKNLLPILVLLLAFAVAMHVLSASPADAARKRADAPSGGPTLGPIPPMGPPSPAALPDPAPSSAAPSPTTSAPPVPPPASDTDFDLSSWEATVKVGEAKLAEQETDLKKLRDSIPTERQAEEDEPDDSFDRKIYYRKIEVRRAQSRLKEARICKFRAWVKRARRELNAAKTQLAEDRANLANTAKEIGKESSRAPKALTSAETDGD